MSELLKINVNDHTEKKGGLTYLSWAWAWAEVLKIDPAATWVVHQYGPQGSEQPCMWIGDTAMVHTSVTINSVRRECLLPVMDNRNNAVKSPDARKISDAIMRCMTKAIAMHGLGLYIYAGEDLPQEADAPRLSTAQCDEIATLLNDTRSDFPAFMEWVSKATGTTCAELSDIPDTAYKPILKTLKAKKEPA